MKRLLICLGLLLGLYAQSYATEFIWTQDSAVQFPKTVGSGYTGHTIVISGGIKATGDAFYITAPRVTIKGSGGDDTLFYGTGGANSANAITFTSAGDTFTIRDLVIMHDPQNDRYNGSEWDDTASNVNFCTAINTNDPSSAPYGINIINCRILVYGENANCIDTYGNGVGVRNMVIDSCHFWNMTDSYTDRQYYGGAACRLEIRGGGFGASDFTVHIYRSVVHRSSHSGFAVLGKADASPPQLSPGTEIAYCTTYVDAVNKYGGSPPTDCAGNKSTSCDNAYGILLNALGPPTRVHHNYISNGTVYSGSRGILMEGCKGTLADPITIDSNVVKITSGPTEENCNGHVRVLRIRAITSGGWDYLWIHHNWFEAVTDNNPATTHIGTNADVLQLGLDAYELPDKGHLTLEYNTGVYRSLASSGTFGSVTSYATFSDFTKAPPLTIRYNKYISSEYIYFGADKYNGGSADSIYTFADTLSFLPPGDTGQLLSTKRVWSPNYYGAPRNESGSGSIAYNSYYVNGATDTNIVLAVGGSNDFTLVQRINIAAIGNNGLVVDTAGFKVWNSKGALVLNAPAVPSGDTLFDFRYFYTWGTSAGTDTSLNPFTVWVWKGSDTTKVASTTIDWNDICFPVHLAATAGTLPATDTCPSVPAPDTCPNVGIDSVPNGATTRDITPNYVFDIADLTNDTVAYKILRDSYNPPTTVRFSGTVATPASNITHTESGLADRTMYYWRIAYTDTVDVSTAGGCTETTSVYSYFVDTVKCPVAASVTPINGSTVTTDTVRPTCNFQTDDYSNIIVRFYGETGDITPDVLLYTDTLTTDSTGWNAFKWTGLSNGLTYYWQVVTQDPDCTDSSDIRSFNVVITAGAIPSMELEGTEIEGITIGKAHENENRSGTREVGWGASSMAAGPALSCRAYSGPACLAVSPNAR